MMEAHQQWLESISGSNRRVREKDFAVADIVFAFNNTRMTELLKERAKHLSVADFEKAKKTQKVMTMLKNIKFDYIN